MSARSPSASLKYAHEVGVDRLAGDANSPQLGAADEPVPDRPQVVRDGVGEDLI
jgi:hypothetical protein